MLLHALLAHAEPVHGYADLHVHLGAHLTVPVYGDGPAERVPERPTHRHALRPQLFETALAEADTTLFVSLAYANPFSTAFETRASMRARIERQLAFVEEFCAEHRDRYALARTPAEARSAIASGQVAVVHGIEGMTKLLADPADAEAWARRGVAVVTPVHLADNGLGGASCQSGSLSLLNTWGCVAEGLAPRRHGLTRKGKAMVEALVAAGIVVDLAHTSPASFAEMLAILRGRGVAPVYTHVSARAVRDDRGALPDDAIRAIYAEGGLVGVTANLHGVEPRPAPLDAACPGSIDDFRRHWDHVVGLAGGAPVAWGSDFQGGIDHLRPKYGSRGCFGARPDGAPLDAFDVEGLAHVGHVGPFFRHLAAEGSDRGPLDASAERFLQVWERARGQ